MRACAGFNKAVRAVGLHAADQAPCRRRHTAPYPAAGRLQRRRLNTVCVRCLPVNFPCRSMPWAA